MADAERRRIGVVVERQSVDNPWIDHRWQVTDIFPAPAAVADWTCLERTPSAQRYYAGAVELALFPRETETLKYNVEGAAPAVYVFLRTAPGGPGPGMALAGATVCVGEAHAHADTGSDLVEAVPMPSAILDWVRAFVAEHHVEREGWKRKREGVREAGPGKRTAAA